MTGFVNHNGTITNYTIVRAGPEDCGACNPPSSGFNYSGLFVFPNVVAGDTYGFVLNGSFLDGTGDLHGTLTVAGTLRNTISLATSANPALVGSPVTLTATVTVTGSQGTVAFTDSGTPIAGCAAVPLVDQGAVFDTSTATCTTSSLAVGSHAIDASYSGDTDFSPNYTSAAFGNELTEVIVTSIAAPTTTTISSDFNPIAVGGLFTLTSTVAGDNPTGTVDFTEFGSGVCASAPLQPAVSGQPATATCTVSLFVPGTHSIVASYSGDTGNAASSSAPLAQIINYPWVLLPVAGASIAQVNDDGQHGPPVLQYGTNAGASTGSWTFQTTASRSGPITLDWWNDGFAGIAGASAGLSVFVTSGGNTTTTPLYNDGPVDCDPCTTPSATFSYHGRVDLVVNAGDTYGFVMTAGNTDQYTVGGVFEVYEGDLSAGPSSLTLSSSGTPAAAGDAVTFTAHVNSNNPVGSVTFFSDGHAIKNQPGDSSGDCVMVATQPGAPATCTVSSLTAGSHTITARYAGTIYSPEAFSDPLTQDITGGGPASFTVVTTADAVDANPGDGICADSLGRCTLRAAIMEANALPGQQTIYLGDGVYNVFPGSPGAFDISDDLAIVGIGAPFTHVSGNNVDRVFNITAGTVTLSQLTVRNGLTPAGQAGAGILNQGNLQLDRVEVRDNVTAADGAGIFNVGTLTVDRSTIADNVGGAGAGIYSYTGWLSMTNSTVSGNHSIGVGHCGFGGGGLYIDGGNAFITSSTIFNNVAECIPGSGGQGDAIATGGGAQTFIQYSIVTGPTQNFGFACWGDAVTSQGKNIVGDSSCSPAVSDLVTTNPLIGALGYNGGLTRTHLPWVGSPALDAITPPCSITGDQSGVARPQGAGCDIGSFEAGPSGPPYTPATPTASAAGSGQLSVAFGPPGTDGGSPITSYTATCNAYPPASGSQSASGAGS
ncbi:MAG: Ig-like domain-containing protein, partial [Betaproteobacteria bacterium]